MKVEFNNMIQVERMKDVLGYEWNKTSNFMNGFKHKVIDGVNLLDVQIFNNNSKWDGLVSQEIRDDGQITMRVDTAIAEGAYITDYCMDNVFHGFIPADIEVERERLLRVKMGAGYSVRKVMKLQRSKGYLYGKYKIVDMEQDVESGDYIIIMRPQHIDTPVS